MIKAVIFDMDGVVSDTLQFHSESEVKVLSLHGITMTHKQIVSEFNAVPDDVMFREIFLRQGKKMEYQKIKKKKFEIFKKISKGKIKPIPHVLGLIEKLTKNNFLLGIASSAPTEIMNFVLKELKIEDKFQAITSTEEVKNGKPHPDIFLKTAEKLDVKSANSVVIEDAPKGIEAAKNAKMKAIGITTNHGNEELRRADLVIDSFKELNVKIIKNL